MKDISFMDPQFDEAYDVCNAHDEELVLDKNDELFCSKCEPEKYLAWLEENYDDSRELNRKFCSENTSMCSLLHTCKKLLSELLIPEGKKAEVESLITTINKFI